jgi:anthranilate phosphoribosyltransferase
MNEIMDGKATDAQIAALITALRIKGETANEIYGFAKTMRSFSTPIVTNRTHLVDTCGTGGDASGTFNISTAAALVVAGAGVKVAKHGNRSVSSKSGSADVLEALGVDLSLSPADLANCIENVGIAFLFAPALHPAMKYAIGPRREIGIRTIFNVLGPLTNPARANHQLLGVYDGELTETLAEVLAKLGSKHALVVHGANSMDEISVTGETKVSELKNGLVETYKISPEDFGLPVRSAVELKGGSPEDNAKILLAILKGEEGAKREAVIINAAAALYAADDVVNIKKGIKKAINSIDSGAALSRLNKLIEFTSKVGAAS